MYLIIKLLCNYVVFSAICTEDYFFSALKISHHKLTLDNLKNNYGLNNLKNVL